MIIMNRSHVEDMDAVMRGKKETAPTIEGIRNDPAFDLVDLPVLKEDIAIMVLTSAVKIMATFAIELDVTALTEMM